MSSRRALELAAKMIADGELMARDWDARDTKEATEAIADLLESYAEETLKSAFGESTCGDCGSMTHCETHRKIDGCYPDDYDAFIKRWRER